MRERDGSVVKKIGEFEFERENLNVSFISLSLDLSIRLIFITPRFTFEVMERDPAKGTLITRIPVNEIYRDGNVARTYVDKLFTRIYMDRFLCRHCGCKSEKTSFIEKG